MSFSSAAADNIKKDGAPSNVVYVKNNNPNFGQKPSSLTDAIQ